MWGRREPPAELAEIVALIRDLGQLLMGIDAKLERVVELLEENDGEGD
jgi:hypothetical protein